MKGPHKNLGDTKHSVSFPDSENFFSTVTVFLPTTQAKLEFFSILRRFFGFSVSTKCEGYTKLSLNFLLSKKLYCHIFWFRFQEVR